MSAVANVGVTVLADRGFGDQSRCSHLGGFGWTFVIRFRDNILVESADGESKTAADWVPSNGRPKMLKKARVTADRAEVGAVVWMKAAGMKEAWCLATNRENLSATQLVELYGRRFTIEETFRDQKASASEWVFRARTSAILFAAIGCSCSLHWRKACSLCSVPPAKPLDSTAT